MRTFQLIPIVCLLFFPHIIAGASASQSDTVWNQTDDRGWKQGYWKKYYPNGEVLYRGFFRNDTPVGKFERYYDNGKIKAVLLHTGRSETVYATMYFQNGQAGAVGKYTGQKRDSIWNYYSYYTGTLSCQESYSMGHKDGPSFKYYPEGTMAELLYFRNGMKHGKWTQFYEDSTLRLSAVYDMDQLHGKYCIYNRNQIKVLDGTYLQGKKDGDWKFYDDEGKITYTVQYSNGEILDEKDREKWIDEFMKDLEKNFGRIPEPDINNFFK